MGYVMYHRKFSCIKTFGAFVLFSGFTSSVFAWAANGSAYNVPGSVSTCKVHNIGDACVGNSLYNNGKCVNWDKSSSTATNRGTESDEAATLLFIAHKIKSTGAKFCLTQVQGANKDKNKGVDGPWIVYYAAAGGVQKCFWLCKPGYGGNECEEAASSTVCDPSEISRNAFANYKISTSKTVSLEDTAWLFSRSRAKCAAHGKDEHEMFLAISGWVPSGHGALVAPMIARAERNGWKPMYSTATIYTAGESTLMCANGYKANPSGTDCEPIDASACQLQNGTFCNGFTRDKFDANIHSLDSSGRCLRYFCQDSNQAFPSVGSVECVDCAKGIMGGPRLSDGVCVKCELGQYFDSAQGVCKTATGYSRTDMQYGKDKTKNTSPSLDTQCWTKTAPEEYITCVKGESTSASGSAERNTKIIPTLKRVESGPIQNPGTLIPVNVSPLNKVVSF